MKEVEDQNALKHMFDEKHLKRVAAAIQKVYPSFDQKTYVGTMPKLKSLEMKGRVRLLRDELHTLLPSSYPKALSILLKAIRAGNLQSFDLWPITEFIQLYGLEDLNISLEALKEITQVFTSEWAIRPFIKKYPKETMKFLSECSKSKITDVRRWSSEGTRPRLPWGERLQDFVKDPTPTLAILNTLKFDDELFVRKSVANHINDIAKDHPLVAIRLLKAWQKEARKPDDQKKVLWIVRHAMRTLIKEGHPEALSLLGVSSDVKVQVKDLKLSASKVRMGEKLPFSFSIQSKAKADQSLIIDYRIHFMRANGTPSVKVFKLKNVTLKAGEALQVEKAHPFKEITTREYYDGAHVIDIQINGVVKDSAKFILSGAVKRK